MMRTYLAGVQREFWENQGSFIYLPLVITGLLLIVCSYVVIMHASPDTELGMEVLDQFYQGEKTAGNDDGESIDFSTDDATVADDGAAAPVDFIVDFEKGELTPAPRGSLDVEYAGNGPLALNAFLHVIHMIFLNIMGIALFAYLLNTLYSDREDRSVLFWKSLPVSETRNVLTKLLVAVIGVPVFVTVVSWLAQLAYVLLALIFVYRLDLDPWTTAWPQLDILQAFFREIVFVLWVGIWMLPVTAWLLFASAWARKLPFLVAVMPFVVVIVFEKLLFDTSLIAGVIGQHFQIFAIQTGNIMQETMEGIRYGSIDLALALPGMITGVIIASVLIPAAIWLRNNRFEI